MMSMQPDLNETKKFIRGLAELMQGSGRQFTLDEALERDVVRIVGEQQFNLAPIDEIKHVVVAHLQARGAVSDIPRAAFDEVEAGFAAARPDREFSIKQRHEFEQLYDLGLTSQASAVPQLVSLDEQREEREINALQAKVAAQPKPTIPNQQPIAEIEVEETREDEHGR